MNNQLTYADRELLFQTFDSLRATSDKEDGQIIKEVSQQTKHISPRFGYEHVLLQDIVIISRYLKVYNSNQDISNIARGALLYVLQSNFSEKTGLSEFSLLNDSFICNYAVHEIKKRLGEQAIFSPIKLTQAEQQKAENLFLEFVDSPTLEKSILIERSLKIVVDLQNLSLCCLFQRFSRNIEFLVSVLSDSGRSGEQKKYACAALNYLIYENDAIEDNIGIIGYIDDNFIIQLAVDFINPNREPWVEFLEQIVSAWPFLNEIAIDDGAGSRPFSEYMIINSALVCNEVHVQDFPRTVLLMTPVVGLTPFLLGFVSTLGLIQKEEGEKIKSFVPGDKVLVDKVSVAEFAGFKEINGRKLFGLRQYNTHRGQRCETVHYWPIQELSRLTLASPLRKARGKIIRDLRRNETPLPAIDYLVNARSSIQIREVNQYILVVSPAVAAYDAAKKISLFGYPLKDVIPMGHISSDEKIKEWSNKFGQRSPILLFVSDLDAACAFAEKDKDSIHLIVVDANGRNSNKIASFRRLQQFKIPMVLVCPERIAKDFDSIIDDSVGVWEWNPVDLSALVWPAFYGSIQDGPLEKYEKQLQPSFSEIRCISLPATEQTFIAIRNLQALASERGTDCLVELEELVGLSFSVMSRLLRSVIAFTEHIASTKRIESDLDKFDSLLQNSRYLTSKEKGAGEIVKTRLGELFSRLKSDNPKTSLLNEILQEQSNSSIICPDVRLFPDLEGVYKDQKIQITLDGEDSENSKGGIIPGWFRKDRMAKLLIPPAADPLYLLFYEIEQKWYSDFQKERERARKFRLKFSDRGKLFPQIKGWRGLRQESVGLVSREQDSKLQQLDTLQQYVQSTSYQQTYLSAKSEGIEKEVSAFLVIFEGNFYSFLTESFRANIVTHLLNGSIKELGDRAEIKQKQVKHLTPGDFLLFHKGSDSDIIRMEADKLLPPLIREIASKWRMALLEYTRKENLTPDGLWKQLNENGCPLTFGAIHAWLENDQMIAPQADDRDVGIIAKVTGDKFLAERMEEVLSAIRQVRSAHLRVSRKLAKQVMEHAIDILKGENKRSELLEIEPRIVLARIVEIADEAGIVRISLTNRILKSEQWCDSL